MNMAKFARLLRSPNPFARLALAGARRLRSRALWAAIPLLTLAACASKPGAVRLNDSAPAFDGELAYHYALDATAFGPRPPGSAAHAKLLAWLEGELAGSDWEALPFTAHTPDGPIPMTNLVARFRGTAPGVIVIGGHYDTLSHRPDFVGANDGGSSTGILLALAKHFEARPPRGPSVWIVWFDGEEAIRSWVGDDHTYGSRELARRWKADSSLKRVRAVLVLDMIGDRRLTVARETNATPWLMNLVCKQAQRIGAGACFCNYEQAIEDDDAPFRAAGIPGADLIDFRYGPFNSYWHTKQDTADKLSPRSFHIVGSVVLATVHALAAQPNGQAHR
ncbi:MAG: M28 family metallopeptidase [Gammaproteobacteria bacterium]